MDFRVGQATIDLVRGDIAAQEVDAIVNAANSRLAGGGGVDGAIHRAGGPQIMEECRRLGGCPTGSAVATAAGNLRAHYVIHAVGPIWRGGVTGEAELLASAYRRSIEVARDLGAKTIAFPSISTGAYGFPIEHAARVALTTVRDAVKDLSAGLERVRFVLFTDADLLVYQRTAQEIFAA